MRKKIINFEELFNDYFVKWYEKNSGKYKLDEIEDEVPKLYVDWLESKDDALGCAPKNYYDGLSAGDMLEMVDEFIKNEWGVCDILSETIAKSGDDRAVFAALKNAESSEKQSALINILADMESKLPLELYADWVLGGGVDEDVREHAAEILKDYSNDVSAKLLENIDDYDYQTKLLALDILVNAEKHDSIFKLLLEMMGNDSNIDLIAGYFAKYQDERALDILQVYIKREDITRTEFLELRNAIEALGGEVDKELVQKSHIEKLR